VLPDRACGDRLMADGSRARRVLLRVWRDVPFPNWMREVFLRLINPSVMIGAMALIQDERQRVLVVEHTYRRRVPWGLPGGWLKTAESPEDGLRREVFEETGLQVRIAELLAADFWTGSQFDLLYRCEVLGGTYRPSDETARHRWASLTDLPELLPNQWALLRKAGLLAQPNG
jgi:ADP-ribose pyrophosphatase YjhB (NUDIX family)